MSKLTKKISYIMTREIFLYLIFAPIMGAIISYFTVISIPQQISNEWVYVIIASSFLIVLASNCVVYFGAKDTSKKIMG